MPVELGRKYRDTISGWEGVATGRYDYLNGCQRVSLSGAKDGKPEEYVFDVQQLIDIVTGIPADDEFSSVKPVKAKKKAVARVKERVGGPRSTPSRTGL